MHEGQKINVYQRKKDGKCFMGRPHSTLDSLIVVWTQGHVDKGNLHPFLYLADNYKFIGRLLIKTVIQ